MGLVLDRKIPIQRHELTQEKFVISTRLEAKQNTVYLLTLQCVLAKVHHILIQNC